MIEKTKIDAVETALANTYMSELPEPVIPDMWQSNVMHAVREETSRMENNMEKTARRFLYISWVAAGIAAGFVLFFSLFYDVSGSVIENDLQNLYVDNSVTEYIPGVS